MNSLDFIHDADPDEHYDFFSENLFDSKYFSLAEYDEKISEYLFSIVGHNKRTFKNIDSLLLCFPSVMPSIFCLSETRFSINNI